MKILNLVQGSDEWLAARGRYNTASEASMMMGKAKVSRSELLQHKATGSEEEFSRWVLEVLFAGGHEIEAKARPIAEEIIGEELFPVTAVSDDDAYLASFDGVTMDETTIWECKQWNEDKASNIAQGTLPTVDRWQVVQQLLVSGADRCLYMVTDGTPDNTVHLWVEPNRDEFDHLIASWSQFDIDRAAYAPKEVSEVAVGRAPENLPALLVEVTGMVTASNLEAYKDHAFAVFGSIKTDLSTDADFADAESTVKWCKSIEDKLESTKENALAQTATIDELFRTIDAIKEEARQTRLGLEKKVKSRKQEVREEILFQARDAINEHVAEINEGLPNGVVLPEIGDNIAGEMKGKRTIASLRNAADTEVARVKVQAGQVVAHMHANLAILEIDSEEYPSLFHDVQALIMKDRDDMRAVIKGRIRDHEDHLQKLQEEEVERQRIANEQAEAVEATEVRDPVVATDPVETPVVDIPAREAEPVPGAVSRPTDTEILRVLSNHYKVDPLVVIGWLQAMDLEPKRRAAGSTR